MNEQQSDLIDLATGQRVFAKDMSDLEAGIKDGRYGYPAQKELILRDQFGNRRSVDAPELRQLLTDGETIHDMLQSIKVKENTSDKGGAQ